MPTLPLHGSASIRSCCSEPLRGGGEKEGAKATVTMPFLSSPPSSCSPVYSRREKRRRKSFFCRICWHFPPHSTSLLLFLSCQKVPPPPPIPPLSRQRCCLYVLLYKLTRRKGEEGIYCELLISFRKQLLGFFAEFIFATLQRSICKKAIREGN